MTEPMAAVGRMVAVGRRQSGRSLPMRIVVDLNRCQGYAQCVYLAHEVFMLNGQEALTY